jgi:2-polyprenyl-3-methyl-5-hydroxy-6-metoxy-1,4-benzoquinol methylase
MKSVAPERRFEFGKNWTRFAGAVTDEQRDVVRESLREWLGDLAGASFLDVGAGSGLFAAAAAELGAYVQAFDFDPASPEIERGDVLDCQYMRGLGTFDVVYAWGVLHHTGDMWKAFENTVDRIAPGGRLLISIYNDQGWRSSAWRRVKRTYTRLPRGVAPLYAAVVFAPVELRTALKATLRLQSYAATWRRPKERGMDKWRDILDWVGGFPFEVAKPEQVFGFCRERGLQLERMHTVGGSSGCNEFLFRRP